MLGYDVYRYLKTKDLEVIGTYRGSRPVYLDKAIHFEASSMPLDEIFMDLKDVDYVINCIGIIPQKFESHDSEVLRKMISINTVFSRELSRLTTAYKFRVLQIATDCVFSGKAGDYSELSIHDAEDIYGVSKSLGELDCANTMHIRSSIIGRHDLHNTSLNNWILSQTLEATLNGYTNHLWNGVTTVAFAKVIFGVISNDRFISGTQHLVPGNEVTKYELLKLISEFSGRQDLQIIRYEADRSINRVLSTQKDVVNRNLWICAGYSDIPTISQLVRELYVEFTERKINEPF